MDQWELLKQYELQQRQQRIAKEHRLDEDRLRKDKETENLQFLREQSRIESEKRQEERRSLIQQRKTEKRSFDQQAHDALLAQSAEHLRIVNQRNRKAQLIAEQKLREEAQAREKGSPIEAAFYEAWCNLCPDINIQPQYTIGNRRVDFAHPETMTAIEIDGHEFHSKRKDRTRDYQRQRQIEDQGWFFVRFTGSEVFHDVKGCVHVLWNRITGRMTR